jgi:hypothetical protein
LDELETLNVVPKWYLRGIPCRESELGNEREIVVLMVLNRVGSKFAKNERRLLSFNCNVSLIV